jgi:cytochrome c-type biogenesis protein CcmH
MNDQLATLRQQLLQLKSLHEQGVLDAARYEEQRAPLERKLVDAVTAAETAEAAPPRPSRMLVAGLSSLVVMVACAGYLWTGAPELIAGVPRPPAAAEAAPAQVPSQEQIAAMVEKLAARLKETPDDAQGWSMLARAYAVLGRVDDAVPAYAKAVALRGDDASLLADYADVLAVRNGRKLDGEPMKLVARALQIAPDNPKALALAGTAAFDNKDYANAVVHWEKLLQAVPAGSDYRAQVQAGIAEARQLGKLPPSTALAANDANAPPAAAPSAAAKGASVSGSVSIAAALVARAAPGDTVFVFARAAEGPRLPLAVLRKQVKDLPFDFELDDSMAMSPAAKLSGAAQVVVGVRVSKSGDATPQDGDLTGQSAAVAPGAKGLKITIADVVKK